MPNPDLPDALRLTVGRLARRLRQHSLGELTPSQRSVLATLGRNGPVTMGALAELEGISRPSVTGIVGRLVDQGMIERQSVPDDGRCSLVALTEGGSATLEAGRDERTAFLALRIDRFGPQDRQVLAEAVTLLNRMVDEE